MATIIIDGKELEVGDDERLNGIEAAARLGIEVPHYCWHPGLSVVASCRMCLVETGTRDADTGDVRMVPKLVPACQTPAKDGTVFVTDSEKIRHSRTFVEEALLMDHPIDCPVCDKAGECHLQDYHFKYGQEQRRADVRPFHSRRRDVGPTVTLFVDRCVMCSRCVRFTREVAGTAELMVTHRGNKEEIDIFPGYELANKLSGNVVDLCPVGALGDRDFLYQQRVWFMKSHPGVCAGCASGCSIQIDENQGTVYRLKPRENQQVNKWWMCDEGRYGFHHMHDEARLNGPWKREGENFSPADWVRLLPELKERLARAGRLAAVVSPFATVEEAYRLCQLMRHFDEQAVLGMGPIPSEGEDESFPGGFTIRAEKCPNRRGVSEVLKQFGGALSFEQLIEQFSAEAIRGAWFAGGYLPGFLQAEHAEPFAKLDLLIVQDLFASAVSESATHVLPATSFAEKEGSYVNIADHLQSFDWAVNPPAGARTEGDVYARLLEKKGMYRARDVLDEVSREVVYFSAAMEPVPPSGIDLKLNQLAGTR